MKEGVFVEKYYSPTDLMTILGIGRSLSYQLFKRADFPSAHVGKKLLISESALREWINSGGTTNDNQIGR